MNQPTEEGASAVAGAGGTVVLRLYVANEAPHSKRALANLQSICKQCSKNRHCRIEVVDALEEPQRALEDGVLVVPTLIKLSPGPIRRLVGELEDTERVLCALELGGEQRG